MRPVGDLPVARLLLSNSCPQSDRERKVGQRPGFGFPGASARSHVGSAFPILILKLAPNRWLINALP